MNKGKVARLVGFVGALGLSTALVTTAVQGTGAYFQDEAASTLNTSSGHLKLLTKDDGQTVYHDQGTIADLDFTGLNPGDRPSHVINYQVKTTGPADLWLVFDTTGNVQDLPAAPPPSTDRKVGAAYQLFTGGGSGDVTGMGRYGFFSVYDSNWGMAFQSGNLKFPTVDNDPATNQCAMTNAAQGRGGSAAESDGTTTPPMCGVPAKILLVGGLQNNDTGAITVTFGTNGPLTTWQDQPGPNVPFQLVAVQAGQTP